MPYASRSDVNIVIAVNPKTAQILLLTIPRDYQIHVPGTSGGLNDKMTHTGSLGGVQLSKATAEELLNIKIDDYIRVNFGFVVGLVDAIGGITIDSDWNTPITCWTNRACIIQPGKNEVDGACALAFSRERMAYDTGDTHRAANQQQVIGKIFEKISIIIFCDTGWNFYTELSYSSISCLQLYLICSKIHLLEGYNSEF